LRRRRDLKGFEAMAASSSVKPIIPALTGAALRRHTVLHVSTPTNMFAQYRPYAADVYAYASWTPTLVLAAYWLAQVRRVKNEECKRRIRNPEPRTARYSNRRIESNRIESC
jgi:hypothetical protein